MGTKYSSAQEVEQIANDLISKYHLHLKGIKIEYVFSDTVPKKGGKEIWGTMRKVSNLNAYLAALDQAKEIGEYEEFFVMTITKPVWDIIDEDKRIALVDHELCHAFAERDEEDKLVLSILPHDLEEFQAIVKRHGLWREDVKNFIASARVSQKNEMDELEESVDDFLPEE